VTDSSISNELIQKRDEKVAEALELLNAVHEGHRHSSLAALALLALANTSPDSSWGDATSPTMRPVELLRWIKDAYGVEYAANTRESLRDEVLRSFVEIGLVVQNRFPTTPGVVYRLRSEALEVVRTVSTDAFPRAVEQFDGSIRSSRATGRELADHSDLSLILDGLAERDEGQHAIDAARVRRRRALVCGLRSLVLEPAVTETAMQKQLQDKPWVFGGQYVEVTVRRDLVPMQQHDITLVAADRSLTVVELKGPGDPLVQRPRENHLTISSAVGNAVGQCMNYLRSLDEYSLSLGTAHADDLGVDYDYRRANAVVVIGHPERPHRLRATRKQVDQTLRLYNSHLSRIKVITYAELLETAERSLNFTD
jgi:hypothetical protein